MAKTKPLSAVVNRLTYWLESYHCLFFASLCFVFLPACSGTEAPSSKPASSASRTSSGASEQNAAIIFEDITAKTALHHVYANGEETDQFTYLEAMGGGLGVLDYDQDGWPDLFLPGGGRITTDRQIVPISGQLVRNLAGQRLENITASAHAEHADYYSQGVAVGDVNNDGFPDLLVTGYGGLNLFLNLGDGTFAEASDAWGLNDPSWSTSAGFGDFDGDGMLDFYVAHYVDWSWENHPQCKSTAQVRDICPPAAFSGLQDVIFMNTGDGSFRRVTSEVGLIEKGKGLGVVCADLNKDSRIEIYVANDTTNNFLYANEGNGQFKEMGVASGTALDERGISNGSMGIAVLDFDGDLNPDIWVCNYEDETFALYKNDGDLRFRHVTSSTGIAALGTLFVAFGTVAADFDNDGDEDLAVVNGHVLRFPPDNTVEQFPLFLTNSGRGKFSRQQFEPNNYFAKKWRGRGMVSLDFDRDGSLDLATSNVNQPAALLANRTPPQGNWCGLQLIGQRSNRDAIGAQIIFRTDAKSYLRLITGGGSYLSQSVYTVHCAFRPGEQLQQVEITWPSGTVETLKELEKNQYNRVVEAAN